MNMLRLLVLLVTLVLVAVMGLLLYLHYADLNSHRSTIENLVSKSAGREFRIDGDLQLTLWPDTEILVDGLSLANAPWGDEPTMLEVGHIWARIAPLSLLSGPARVEQLEVRDVRVLVENDGEGQSNWDFGAAESAPAPEPAPSQQSGELPAMLGYAELTNILLTLRQPGVADRVLRLDEFMLQPGATDLELAARGEVLDRAFGLAGSLGPLDAQQSRGAVKLQLDGNVGELSLKLRGRVDDLISGEGAELDALIDADDIGPLLASAAVDLPLQGPLHVEATLNQLEESLQLRSEVSVGGIEARTQIVKNGQRFQLEQKVSSLSALGHALAITGLPDNPLDLSAAFTLGKRGARLHAFELASGDTRFEAEGLLSTGGGVSDLEVTGKGGSMASVFAKLPDIPFDASADVELSTGKVMLGALSLKLGQSDINGDLMLAYPQPFAVEADLSSRLIDLGVLLPPTAPEALPAPAGSAADKRYVFKDKPLPLESLQALDMDVTWSIERLQDSNTVVQDIRLRAAAKRGKIDTSIAAKGPYGGVLRNELALEVSDKDVRLDGEAYTRDMRFNLFSGDVTDPLKIPVNNVTVKVKSRGSSPRQIAAGAKGSVLVTQGAGLINNNLLSTVSGDVFAQLFNALNPLAKAEKLSKWECSLVLVKIDGGKALLEQMILQGEKVMIVGGGEVDLKTERLKLEFNTKPRKGVGVSADMFIKPFVALEGTLASPAIGLNEKGTLISAGAAVATGGLSFLVKAAADRLGGNVDHCSKTLPDFPHPPLPE